MARVVQLKGERMSAVLIRPAQIFEPFAAFDVYKGRCRELLA